MEFVNSYEAYKELTSEALTDISRKLQSIYFGAEESSTALENEINYLKTVHATYTDSTDALIKSLSEGLDSQNEDFDSFIEEYRSYKSCADENFTDIDEAFTNFSQALDTAVYELSQGKVDKESFAELSQGKVDKESFAELKSAVATLSAGYNNYVSGADARTERIESMIGMLSGDTSALSEKISSETSILSDKITDLNDSLTSEISQLKSSITTNSSDISSLKSSMGNCSLSMGSDGYLYVTYKDPNTESTKTKKYYSVE